MRLQLSVISMAVYCALFSASSMAQDSAELDTINVIGQNRSTKTENTDSYTTSAMRTTTGLALTPKETPQSVSVITKKQLDDQGISNMADALRNTTGINVIEDSGKTRYQSRGFYIDQIEEDGVSSTVAGSSGNPYRDAQSMTDLAIYDHIEVVRGATGLTQANGEPGGTINAVRKKPTRQFQANGEVAAGSWDRYRAMGDVSGSLNSAKTIRGRLVGVWNKTGSFKDIVSGHNETLYGVMEADLGENTKLTLGALYQNKQDVPDSFGIPMGFNGADAGLDKDTYLGADWNQEKYRKRNAFAELEHYFNDDWKITGKLNYVKNNSLQEYAGLANSSTSFTGVSPSSPYLTVNNMQRYDNEGWQGSAQVNVTGKYELFGRKHDLFSTLSFSKEKADSRWRRVMNSTAYDVYQFSNSALTQPNWDDRSTLKNDIDYVSNRYQRALQLGTRFNLSDRWHLIAGGRYVSYMATGYYQYTTWNGKPDNEYGENTPVHEKKWVPYAGITWDVTPNTSLYASYTEIFKPQSVTNEQGDTLDPVVGTNYEIGTKSTWLDNRLNTSAALFQIVQKNRAIYDSATGFYNPEGKVRSRGLDLEVSGEILPDWNVFAGYTFNMSKYLETESTRYAEGANFNPYTPKHMFRLYTSYQLPGVAHRWTIGGGVNVQSKTNSIYNIAQGGYALWNANIQYDINKNLRVSLIGNNLTDKRYYQNQRVRVAGMNNFYGDPRNFMFKLNWKL